jgi:transcription elongation factor GreA
VEHGNYVRVGSSAVVRRDDGGRETFVIVPPERSDPRSGLVAPGSAIGRALLGRRVGESVTVLAPGGSFVLTIESVAFERIDRGLR